MGRQAGRAGAQLPGPVRLVLELVSPEEVDEVVVLSVDGKLTFRDSQEGVDFAGDRAKR